MHDPMTLIYSAGPFQLWHNDPCKGPGGDDSCGWFMRAHHGKPEVLEAIKKRIDFDFDRTWSSYSEEFENMTQRERDAAGVKPERTYHCGLFCPNGDPHFSVQGIVLNVFHCAAWAYFHDKHKNNTSKAWRESSRFMQAHLFEILLFAENPTDSLHNEITGKFRIACSERWKRDDALEYYAALTYGWILRAERPWYRHPRWHVHHWSFNIHWSWFLPRWLDKKVNPGKYACCDARPA